MNTDEANVIHDVYVSDVKYEECEAKDLHFNSPTKSDELAIKEYSKSRIGTRMAILLLFMLFTRLVVLLVSADSSTSVDLSFWMLAVMVPFFVLLSIYFFFYVPKARGVLYGRISDVPTEFDSWASKSCKATVSFTESNQIVSDMIVNDLNNIEPTPGTKVMVVKLKHGMISFCLPTNNYELGQ